MKTWNNRLLLMNVSFPIPRTVLKSSFSRVAMSSRFFIPKSFSRVSTSVADSPTNEIIAFPRMDAERVALADPVPDISVVGSYVIIRKVYILYKDSVS
jgi:hypothetical protein